MNFQVDDKGSVYVTKLFTSYRGLQSTKSTVVHKAHKPSASREWASDGGCDSNLQVFNHPIYISVTQKELLFFFCYTDLHACAHTCLRNI